MIVATYDQWHSMKLAEATAANREVENEVTCEKCEGEGITTCSIDGKEQECPECYGEGTYYVTEMSLDVFEATREQYFEETVSSAKKFCAWCNRDFLGEIGLFIKEFRGCA